MTKRYLGIDHGSVRIGLALSDELAILATPFRTIPGSPRAPDLIREIVQEYDVGAVVVGMPISLSGHFGPQAELVRKFAEKLSARLGVEIIEWDERLTTVEANRLQPRSRGKGGPDTIAAAIMLQSYLDSIPRPPSSS